MARSLRRTLVGWLGSLLACVIAVFGWTLHGRVSRAVLAQADASIESRGQAILAALEWDEKDGWELDLAEDYMRDWGGESWLEVRDRAGSMVQSVGPLPAPLGAGLGFHGSAAGRELVLAGPHGAGLANAAFMRPGGAVLELRQVAGTMNSFHSLAAARKQRYFCLPCEPAVRGHPVHAADLVCEPEALDRALSRVVETVEASRRS